MSDRRDTAPDPVVVLTPHATRIVRIERVPSTTRWPHLQHVDGLWRIWIAANKDFTLGTYLELHDDGRVNRVTLREGEGDDIMNIKPEDN